MKKIFTLLSFVLFAMMSYAQDTYAFSDKDGNVYADAATIECTTFEEDDFGGIIMPSGLYVKNVAAASNYQISIVANIQQMDNGAVQLCFPKNCSSYDKLGKQSETAKASIAQGAVQNMMTEWLPTAYGECTVLYTMKIYDGIFSKGSRTITAHYKYADPTGIKTLTADRGALSVYDLQGRRVAQPTKGLYIVNGRKVVFGGR